MTASTLPAATVLQVGIRQRSLRRHCRLGRATELVFILATGLTLTLGGQATAQDRTWDAGAGTTNWLTLNNWAGSGAGRVPDTAAETAKITGTGGANQPVLEAADSVTVGSTILSGGSLTVAGTLTSPVTVSGPATLTNDGTIIGNVNTSSASAVVNNNATLTGALTLGGGTATNAGSISGATTVSTGTLNLNTGTDLSGSEALIVTAGTVNVNASDTVGNLQGNGGTVDIDAGQVLTAGGNDVSGVFAGAVTGDGTLSKTGTGTLTLTGANTVAVVSISAGTVAVTGAGTLSGIITGGAAGTLSTDGGALSSTASLTGDITLAITGDEEVSNLFGFFGDIAVNNAADLSLTGGTYNVGGDITGDGSITVDGATATLTGGAKAYTGATNVTSGELILSTGIDSTDVNVSGGVLRTTGDALAAGTVLAISGTGSVNIDDDDTVASVTQTGGTLEGDSTLTVTGTLGQSGGEIASGVTVNVAGGKTLEGGTIAGTLGGAGATTVQTGTTTVTGTITGDVTVAGSGVLRLDSATAVSGSITTTGSTVSYADGQDEGSALIISSATTDLEVLTGEAATQSGVISSTGDFGFEKTGDGNLTVSGTNTYTGVTTVTDGTLTVANSAGLGATGAGNETTVADGATLALTGGITTGEAITLNGEGVATGGALRNISGSNTISGAVTLASDTLITSDDTDFLDQLTISGDITGTNTNLRLDGAGFINITGGITTGSGTLTMDGGGIAFLQGANTFTGATTINSGSIGVTNGSALSDTALVTINAPGLLGIQNSETVGNIAGDGQINLFAGATLTAGDATPSSTFSGAIVDNSPGDAGSLTKQGTGTLELSGSNTYTGATNVNGGTLDVTGSIASAVVNVNNGGTLEVDADALNDAAAVTVAGTGTLTANGDDTIGSLDQQGGTVDGTGQLTAGTYTQSGGDMAGLVATTTSATLNGGTISGTLSGADATVQGPTATTLTGTISSATTITGTLEVDGGDLSNVATLNGGTLAGLSDSTLTGTVVGDAAGGTVTAATGTTLTITNLNTANGGALTIGAAGATGTVVANDSTGANSGSTVAVDAGTLRIGGVSAGSSLLDFTAGTSVAAGATLDIGGFNTTVNALSGTGTVTNSGPADAALVLTGTETFGGTIQDGAGVTGLTVTDSSALGTASDVTLTGTNSFTGDLLVTSSGANTASLTLTGTGSALSGTTDITLETGGTLNIDTGGAARDYGTLAVNGGTLALDNALVSVDALSGTGGTIDLAAVGGASELTFGSDNTSTTYAGDVTGTALTGLVKTGTGTTSITGDIATNGTVTVSSGTLTLSGDNVIDGGIFVDGTLRLESDNAAGGTGGLITTTGSVIDYADGVDNVTDIQIASNTTQVQVTTGSAEQSGVIGEDAAGRPLEKIGAGELVLSAANTFTGDMTVTGGTLSLSGGSALEDSVNLILADGTTVNVQTSEVVGSVASVTGGTVALGANSLTLSGAVSTSFAGNVTGGTFSGFFVNFGNTTTMTGDSTMTGTMGTTGGTLIMAAGATTAAIQVGGTGTNGVFTTNGGALASNAELVNLSTATININGSETIGSIEQTSGGTINVAGGATLTLNGSTNAFNLTGASTIGNDVLGAGTLNVTGGTTTVGAGGNVATATTIGAGGAVVNNGAMAGVGNAGTLTNNGTAGAVTNTGAGAGSNAGTIASLTHNSTGLFTNTNVITGDVSVSAGTVTLSGTSNIGNASTVTVTGGILNAGVADTIGGLVANGGTTNVSAQLTMGELSGTAGSIVTTGTGGLVVGDSDLVDSTFGGVISGAGTLQKVGTDTLTLTGANTLSGGVTVTQGTLALTGSGGLANGPITIDPAGSLTTDGGAFGSAVTITNNGLPAAVAAPFGLMLTGGGDETIASMSGNGTTNLSSGSVLTLSAGTSDVAGVISGAGGLTVNGTSTTNLTAANTYTGDTVVNGGGALNLNGAGAIASAVVTISGNGALTTDGDGIADTAAVSVAGANGILRVNGAETIGSLTQTGGFVNGTSTLTTNSFDQTGGTTSGTVTVATGTFTQNGGTIGTGTTVTQSTSATLSGGTVAGTLAGAGAVTVQTGTTTVTGTISSTNVTVASGELSLDSGEGLTTTTDLTVNGGLVDVNIDEAIATLSGIGGSVDIDAAGSLTLGEATLDTASYAGNVTGAGALIKLGTSTQVFSGANGLTGTVDVNGGTLRITGTIAATDLETAAAGTLETDGGALVNTAVVTNAGTLRITAGTETIASVNGAGGIDLNTGNLTLAGANSTISGAITGSGTLTVNASADGNGAGGATVILSGNSSAYTGTSQVTEGTLRVTATGNLGGPVNVTTLGLFQLEGGILSDSLTNTGGLVEARGTIEGDVTNNNVGAGGGDDEGVFTTTGDVTFSPAATRTFTNAGTVNVSAGSILGLGSYTNQSGGLTTVQSGRTLQATTVNNNAGALMALNGGTVSGNLVNNGTLQSDGSSVITGNLTNGGSVDLDDGVTGDLLTVNGGISGSGIYLLDLNLDNGTSDRVAGTLNTASDVNLVFNRTGAGYIGAAVTVFSGAAAGASVTGSAALPVGGSIIYTLDQVGSDVVVQSQVNPAVGGVAASASMTQALIGTIVNRPTSPFVSGLAAEEGCSQGGYFRATGGRATVAGESSSNGFTTNNSISSDFYGVQGGYDVGCFDGRFFDGWDGAAGLMLGYNAGSTDQSLFSDPTRPTLTTGLLGTEFTQNYIGLYVAGAKDRLSADLQLRYDDTSFDLDEVTLIGAPVGLDGLSYSTKATTIGTRVSYRMDVNEEKGINFVPTAGFNLTHVSGDTLTLAGGETLEIEAFTSVVGFVGGALARTFIAEDGGSATTAFVSGNYYQDFGGDRGALFDIDGDGVNPQNVSVASIGGFGELSLGVNYVKVLDAGTAAGAKQLNASIRGDVRIGQNVSDAYSVTAQVRLSF